MSTHCSIAILNDDGSIDYIYSHFDGYPEYTGMVLREFYTTRESIQKLINLGALSIIGSVPESYEFMWDYKVTVEEVNSTLSDISIYKYCRAMKDRGESIVISHKDSIDDFTKNYCVGADEAYIYLYMQNQWWMYIHGSDVFTPLDEVELFPQDVIFP